MLRKLTIAVCATIALTAAAQADVNGCKNPQKITCAQYCDKFTRDPNACKYTRADSCVKKFAGKHGLYTCVWDRKFN